MAREQERCNSPSVCEMYVVSLRKVIAPECGERQPVRSNACTTGTRHRVRRSRSRSRSRERSQSSSRCTSNRRPHENIVSNLVSETSDLGQSVVENICETAANLGNIIREVQCPPCEIDSPCARAAWRTAENWTRWAWHYARCSSYVAVRFVAQTGQDIMNLIVGAIASVFKVGVNVIDWLFRLFIDVFRSKEAWMCLAAIVGATVFLDVNRSTLTHPIKAILNYFKIDLWNDHRSCWDHIIEALLNPGKYLKKLCIFCPN